MSGVPTPRERLLVGAIMIAVPILYVVWQWVPYFIFYVVPFVLLSALFGGIWTVLCQLEEPDYSRLAVFIPLTAAVVIFIVGFPHDPAFISPRRIQLDWPWIYEAFNSTNEWFQSCLVAITPWPFSKWFAPAVPYEPVLYDLKQVAWITWLAFLAGGPLTFFLFYQQEKAKVMATLEKQYQKKTDEQEKRVQLAESNAKHANDTLKNQVLELKADREKLQREHDKLKALLEFEKKGDRKEQAPKPEAERTKGVLDSDLL